MRLPAKQRAAFTLSFRLPALNLPYRKRLHFLCNNSEATGYQTDNFLFYVSMGASHRI